MRKCLACYQDLAEVITDYHAQCSKKFFGVYPAPELPYALTEISELAKHVIRSQAAVTGVQPKLSLDLEKLRGKNALARFTIVGLWGSYILKPPTTQYPHLPEIEDLTMHLARHAGVATVPHTLIKMKDGTLAYITRRIDREKGSKLFMEDFCQLTERHTEHKYHGSCEQIAKAILAYSANPLLDVINFCEQVLFCFLVGNSDMHSKNYSLHGKSVADYVLTPAYDLVATQLVLKDKEEIALAINGKKIRLKKSDFTEMFAVFIENRRSLDNIFEKFADFKSNCREFVEQSYLPVEQKYVFLGIIAERHKRIYG